MISSNINTTVSNFEFNGNKVSDTVLSDFQSPEYPVTLHSGQELQTNGLEVKINNPECLKWSRTDYEVLPQKYFKYKHIPPPLVSKTWLRVLYYEHERLIRERISELQTFSSDDKSANEDLIPLSNLRIKLLGLHKETPVEVIAESNNGSEGIIQTERLSHSSKSSTPVIQRKRGRPRKKKESTVSPDGNNPVKENDHVSNSVCSEENMEDNISGDIDDNTNDNCWWSKIIDSSNETLSVLHTEYDIKEDVLRQNNEYEDSNTFQLNNENDKNKCKQATMTTRKKKDTIVENQNTELKKIKIKKVYPCTLCDKKYSAASTLRYHLRVHNGTLKKCTECDKSFQTNYMLKCHMRIHTGDLLKCQNCGKGFTTPELVKIHTRTHTGDRPYSCDICGKSFPSCSNLNQHKATHRLEKKYLCFECGAAFSQKRCLVAHMLFHGKKSHICTVCGKLWARRADLEEHMRIHTGNKPYACNDCPQKFSQASSLRRHQLIHKEPRPIKCSACGKLLKNYECYRKHIKRHMKGWKVKTKVIKNDGKKEYVQKNPKSEPT